MSVLGKNYVPISLKLSSGRVAKILQYVKILLTEKKLEHNYVRSSIFALNFKDLHGVHAQLYARCSAHAWLASQRLVSPPFPV